MIRDTYLVSKVWIKSVVRNISKLSYNAKSSQIGNSIDRKHVGLLCHKQAKDAGQNFIEILRLWTRNQFHGCYQRAFATLDILQSLEASIAIEKFRQN